MPGEHRIMFGLEFPETGHAISFVTGVIRPIDEIDPRETGRYFASIAVNRLQQQGRWTELESLVIPSLVAAIAELVRRFLEHGPEALLHPLMDLGVQGYRQISGPH